MSNSMLRLRSVAFAVSLAVAGAVLAFPAPAGACVCSSPVAFVSWPLDGATEVPKDTPIAVTYDSNDWRFTLEAEDGSEVALEETGRFEHSSSGCGGGETVFLRPAAPLAPDARYVATLSRAAAVPDAGRSVSASFTTGDSHYEAEGSREAEVTYFRVDAARACNEGDPWCVTPGFEAVAAMRVRLIDVGERPYWLEVESSAAGPYHRSGGPLPALVDPVDAARSVLTSVGLPLDDPCVAVRVYDVEGNEVVDAQRCEPDHCADVAAFPGNDCGPPVYWGFDASNVPQGSCDEAPVAPDSGVDEQPADAAAAEESPSASERNAGVMSEAAIVDARSDAGGCAVSHGPGSPAMTGWLVAVAFALGLRRRRPTCGGSRGSE